MRLLILIIGLWSALLADNITVAAHLKDSQIVSVLPGEEEPIPAVLIGSDGYSYIATIRGDACSGRVIVVATERCLNDKCEPVKLYGADPDSTNQFGVSGRFVDNAFAHTPDKGIDAAGHYMALLNRFKPAVELNSLVDFVLVTKEQQREAKEMRGREHPHLISVGFLKENGFVVVADAIAVYAKRHPSAIDPEDIDPDAYNKISQTDEFKEVFQSIGEEWCRSNQNSLFCIDMDYALAPPAQGVVDVFCPSCGKTLLEEMPGGSCSECGQDIDYKNSTIISKDDLKKIGANEPIH